MTIEIDALPVPTAETTTMLSLRVAEGESVAIVGADQEWLTPVIRQCGGLDPIEHGRVSVGGLDVGRASHRELLALRDRVGYVSVGGGLFANATLLDNVTLPLRYRGVVDAEATATARELLQEAGLAAVADRRAATVPVELQKLAAYLRALALRPTILLVEDPAAHLHPDGRRTVERLHAQLRDRGATVLVADDDREFAARLTSRLVEVGPIGEAA
jgi:ABC-type polar amino acid transport system ATPase subunit